MTSSRGSNGYYWTQPPDPSSVALWIAEHRIRTRFVVLIVDAVLLGVLITGLFTGENRWYQYLQVPVWAWVTANFGWLMPKSVDDWRRRTLDPIERPGFEARSPRGSGLPAGSALGPARTDDHHGR